MKQVLVGFACLLLIIGCEQNHKNDATARNNDADSSKAEKAESREDRNKKIIKDAYAALNDHDYDKMATMLADDAVEYGDGTGKVSKGRDTVKADIAAFMGSFPDFKGSDLKYFADGDQVVVIGEYSGTFKKDMGKMKATNKSFKFQDADIFTLNDAGKITSHRSIQPTSTMIAQVASAKK
jgi:ketosteroid isomerase-like protein